HPEWIDFPREGNGWSYNYARRQWHLADDDTLKYKYLQHFNEAIIHMVKKTSVLDFIPQPLVRDEGNQILAFERGNNIFVFNFNPEKSFTDFPIHCKSGKYKIVINSDSPLFGGFGLIDETTEFFSLDGVLKVYIPARTAIQLVMR
ncbi:MAG: alpha amylase C-terminal domain-containing protein, partial [Bacteroidales bacterium]|nr:alpha amylase C-terminal domain-containing protein [Bacteroidales bacterium]